MRATNMTMAMQELVAVTMIWLATNMILAMAE